MPSDARAHVLDGLADRHVGGRAVGDQIRVEAACGAACVGRRAVDEHLGDVVVVVAGDDPADRRRQLVPVLVGHDRLLTHCLGGRAGDVDHRLEITVEEAAHVVLQDRHREVDVGVAEAALVGGDDDVLEGPERMLRRQRLVAEHVEGRAREHLIA